MPRTTPRRWLRQLAPAIVLVDEGHTSVTTARWVRAARYARLPVAVCTAADVESPAWPARVLQRRTLRRTNGVFARTPTAARRASQGEVRGPVCLVPPSAIGRLSPADPSSDRPLTVGFAGPLTEDEGIPDLLAAIDRLPRETRLILAGDGPFRAQAEAHHKVDLRGGLLPGEMAALYAELDVLVVPSRGASTRRGLGPVMLEAMAVGTPVIGSTTGDIPWILSESGGGMTFPPGDVVALAGLLSDVRTDPERWRARGRRASSEVDSRFSPGAGAAALLDLAKRILAAQ